MTNNQIDYIIQFVLGYRKYPYSHKYQDTPEGWKEFTNRYFFRNGIIDGVEYTSEQNMARSKVAMLQTIDEIKKRLERMKG